MEIVDELTVLRDAACRAYWKCETASDLVAGGDAEWLAGNAGELASRLNDDRLHLSEACQRALHKVEQAAAIANLPPFAVLGKDSPTATQAALRLITRYWLAFSTPRDDAEIRESLPQLNWEAANNRVREEWIVAVRMLHGVAPAVERTTEAPIAGRSTGNKSPRGNSSPGGTPPKILATLLEHHKYKSRSCLNFDPIGTRELAGKADVAVGSVSTFWKDKFGSDGHPGSHAAYCRSCVNGRLPLILALLNGDMPPSDVLQGIRDDIRREIESE